MSFFYFINFTPRFLQIFYASKYLKLDLPAGKMNAKTKIKIYRTVVEDVCKEYKDAIEFIHNKINELCPEHGISTDKVCLYIFMSVMLRAQFGCIYSLERIYFHYRF